MTTTDSKPSAAAQPFVEQRLDAIDRALLGILPRNERLAFVTQVETRVRELTNGNTAAESTAPSAMDPEVVSDAVSRRAAAASPKRRSRLALSSGILGIVALVMLFAMPITYLVVMTVGEEFGEVVSISLLGIHVLVVAISGLVALVMGIAGLVSLSRRKGRLVGHGWAITGLCTAPLPTLVGGLLVLVTGFSLFAFQAVTAESVPSPRGVAVSPSQPTLYTSPAATCAPASSMPAPNFPKPLAVSAAPSFCPSGEVCSPSVRASYSDDVSAGPNAPPSREAPAPTDPPSKVLTPGPIVPGAPADSFDPPSDDEVLRALDKAKPTQGGFLHSVERNNIRSVKEKVSDSVDPPSVAPLLGPVQLHHAHYKCTVYYTEITRVGWPSSSTVNEDMQDVVYIDHNHLQLAANAVPGQETSY